MMDENKWWLITDYDTTKRIIRADLANMQRSFIDIGCQLMQVRDRELYKDGGYDSVWAFAEQEFGIQRSTASRWMKMCQKFSVDGSSPVLKDEYKDFGKSQLQEMLYLEDEQLEEVTPGMTVKEIRELRAPEKVEEEPVSILGYPLRVYPEGSLISTPGCGKQDCFSCHRGGCEIRQVDCYCVEATMGNPFPCTTLNVVENIRQEVGNKCQFVNEDLAFHRAGDGQPVPCCKKCDHPCGYECRRSIAARHEAAKRNICYVARDEAIDEKHGTPIDELNLSVRTYNVLKRAGVETIEGIQSMTDTDLAMIRNFSRKCMDEVHSKLEEYARNNSENTLCDVAHASEEQIPGQMDVEDFPELLPNQEKTDININNVEDNDVIKQQENVINQPESVIEDDEDAIDAEYKEIAAENTETDEICCQEAADLDELTFSQIAIRDYLEEEEQTLAEYEKVNSEDGGLPLNLMMRQRMIVKALRLLLESEAELEEDDELEEQEEPSPVQSDLPVMRNNDQRKEWLKNYKDWPVWFEVPEASEIYYRFNLPDGSSIVICEYHMWLSWKEKYSDENPDSIGTREYLLNPGYRYLQDCCTNSTALVEHLKNLQKGEKK